MNRVLLALVLTGMTVSGLSEAAPRAFLTDYSTGNIAVIDTATDTLIANSLNVGPQAWSVAIGDNDRAYFFSSAGITVVDTVALVATNAIPLPACSNDSPLTIDPASVNVYIGCNPAGEILQFDLATETVVASQAIANAWFVDLITDASGDRLMAADLAFGDIHFLDIGPLAVDTSLSADVVSTNGLDLDLSQNQLYVPTFSPNELTVIDPVSATVTASIPAPGWHVAVDPVPGGPAYLLDPNGQVSVIDMASNSVASSFNAGSGNYFSSAVHPLDGRLYLLNQTDSEVQVFDPLSSTLLATISLSPFVEPRLVGRWMGPPVIGDEPPAAVGVTSMNHPMWVLLMMLGFFMIATRYLRA